MAVFEVTTISGKTVRVTSPTSELHGFANSLRSTGFVKGELVTDPGRSAKIEVLVMANSVETITRWSD